MTQRYGLDQIGTITNTGGAATLGDALGDLVGSSLASRLTTLQGSVSSIGSGTGAALNFAATSDNAGGAIIGGTTIVGTPTNTYTSTANDNGTYHVITHAGNAIDWVYGFSVGSGRVAAKAVFVGYLAANTPATSKTITVSAWNFTGAPAWETVKTIAGQAGTTDVTVDITLLAAHTGTGADAGKVYIRFSCTGQTGAVLNVDQLIVQAQNLGQTVGYADGAVWVKATGAAGTTPYVNGTADAPCPWANALTIATTVGLTRFRIVNGETVTLSAACQSKSLIGNNWTLALGGQAIDGAYFQGAEVSGTGTCTTQAEFVDCHINNSTTTGPARFLRCGFSCASGTPFTAGSAGEFMFVDCYSEVAAAGTPYFTLSGVTAANFRRWSGGSNITLNNASATLTMEVVTGGGQTIATAGSSIELRGICRSVSLTGIASGATCQIAAVTGPISLAGADGTVNIYGVCGTVSDARTGAPTLTNRAVSQSSNALGGFLVKKTIVWDGLGTGTYTAFTVTGLVAVKVIGYVAAALTNLGVAASVGTATDVDGLIADTLGSAMQAIGTVWTDATPTKFEGFPATWTLIGDGDDIAVTSHATLLAGTVDLYCWYVPISSGASVVPYVLA